MFFIDGRDPYYKPREPFDPYFENNFVVTSWIKNYASNHTWLTPVDDDFINDQSNFSNLQALPNFETSLNILRGKTLPWEKLDTDEVELDAEILYTYVHGRYLMSRNGSLRSINKYIDGIFGRCPLNTCNRQNLLPIGHSPIPQTRKADVYCPNCHNIFWTKTEIDGAFFGPYFPHYFLQILESTGIDWRIQIKENDIPLELTYYNFMGIPIKVAPPDIIIPT